MNSATKLMIYIVLFISLPAMSIDEQGTPAQAHDLVKKAIRYFHSNGQQATMAALNDLEGEFIIDELYVYVYDQDGVYHAIAPKPVFIGKNLMNVRDAKGKPIVKEQLEKLQTANYMWQEYHWENPATKKIALKKTYCERVNTLLFCSGAYID